MAIIDTQYLLIWMNKKIHWIDEWINKWNKIEIWGRFSYFHQEDCKALVTRDMDPLKIILGWPTSLFKFFFFFSKCSYRKAQANLLANPIESLVDIDKIQISRPKFTNLLISVNGINMYYFLYWDFSFQNPFIESLSEDDSIFQKDIWLILEILLTLWCLTQL